MAKDFVINVTNALVTSPLLDFNSAIASSRVNPFLVISLIDFSGKGDGVTGGGATAAAAAAGEGGWLNRCSVRLVAKRKKNQESNFLMT